jgi:pSer/pThr/pTyr-binding forkhead associated (FHA) protein
VPELVAGTGARFQLPQDGGTIGRHDDEGVLSDPDVVLGSLDGGRTVSRRHIHIYRSGDDWLVRVDQHARNRTSIAGRPLTPGDESPLYDGDEIKLGTVSVFFSEERDLPVSNPNATLVRTGPAAAELSAGDVRRALAVADGRFLTLGRHSDDGAYQPDIDLRDALGGATISRRQGLLFRHGDAWFLRVEVGITNPTYLNGALLHQDQEVALTDGDQLQMGSAIAIFHQDKAAEYVDCDRLDLVLGPPTDFTLEAGSQQALPLKLVNFTGRVDWFVIEVRGIPDEWYKIIVPEGRSAADDKPQVRLDTAAPPVPTPSATGMITLVFTPPRRPEATAGVYPLLVTATSQDNRRLRRTAPGQLVVLPFTSLRLEAEGASPARGTRARSHLTMYNEGNTPALVSLSVESTPKAVATVAHPEVTLANGASTGVDLNLRVKRRPWLGPEVVHTATVSALSEGQAQSQVVSLTCPPRIPVWLQNLFGRIQKELKPLVVVAVLAAAVLIAGFLWLFPPDVKLQQTPPLVASGAPATLTWNVERGRGEGQLKGPSGTSAVEMPHGQIVVTPGQTATYELAGKNLIGIAATGSIQVQVLTATITAKTDSLKQPGDPVTLEWDAENATSVTIEPSDEIGTPPLKGSAVVHPQTSTVYHLVAKNDQYGISVTQDVTAAFGASKITKFQPDKDHVYPGDAVTLTWEASPGTRLTLKTSPDDPGQDVTQRTSMLMYPATTTTYLLVATNPDGTASPPSPVTVTVTGFKAPTITPVKPISAGQSATLSWQVAGANDQTRVVLQPGGIDVSGKNSYEVSPAQTSQYWLEVTGADQITVKSDPVTVPVLPAIREFKVSPTSITEGDPVLVSWVVDDADSVTVTRDDGFSHTGKATDEWPDMPPAAVSSYTISATNKTGVSVDSPASTVKIKIAVPTPTPVPPTPPPLVVVPPQAPGPTAPGQQAPGQLPPAPAAPASGQQSPGQQPPAVPAPGQQAPGAPAPAAPAPAPTVVGSQPPAPQTPVPQAPASQSAGGPAPAVQPAAPQVPAPQASASPLPAH